MAKHTSPRSLHGKLIVIGGHLYYGDKHVLKNIHLSVPEKQVTAFIGASGCGKSSLLRCFNRMNDDITDCRISGNFLLDDLDIYAPDTDLVSLRTKVGMVFQKANPFPKSIYDNIAYGPQIHGLARHKSDMDALVQSCLERVGLWHDVKDNLKKAGTALSGGQQQRLCIARAIAIAPEVILMDEPCSALDPIATGVIEELITQLQKDYTIVIVTHSMQQAKRISQKTAFFHLGEMVECGKTQQIFNEPADNRTKDYILGRFG